MIMSTLSLIELCTLRLSTTTLRTTTYSTRINNPIPVFNQIDLKQTGFKGQNIKNLIPHNTRFLRYPYLSEREKTLNL